MMIIGKDHEMSHNKRLASNVISFATVPIYHGPFMRTAVFHCLMHWTTTGPGTGVDGAGGRRWKHYSDVIMGAIASQITSLTIVYSTVYSDADQRKHQSSASLAFVRGIHRGPVNSPHKWPVTLITIAQSTPHGFCPRFASQTSMGWYR